VCCEQNTHTTPRHAVRGGRSWLRQSGRGQKVAGSISDGIIGIFHWVSPSGQNQPLRELSTRDVLWVVKAGGA
jgi:hypothetical protein